MNPKSRVHWGLILGVCLLGAVGGVFLWRATRPVDTAPPPAVLVEAKPDEPLLAEDAQQVTFILRDDQGAIPSLFLFTDESQQAMALGINTLRGTPNERGVEVRFEALRLRRDEHDPDTLWVRAVGIANETEGKTPVSLAELERGAGLALPRRDPSPAGGTCPLRDSHDHPVRPRHGAADAGPGLGRHSLEDAGKRNL